MSVSLARPPPGGKGAYTQILFSRCCGIDVHKDSVTACVLVYSGSPEPEVSKKEFATHFKALGNLRFWWIAQKVTHVAMESTGARRASLALSGEPKGFPGEPASSSAEEDPLDRLNLERGCARQQTCNSPEIVS
jgi:hypothetical protein